MSEVIITVCDMRQAFPEFMDEKKYPCGLIERFIAEAECFISTGNFRIRPQVRKLAIEYLVGHLITLTTISDNGAQTGVADGNIVTSASVDGVSVSNLAPIANDASEQWYQSTPYGKKFWALLTANNPMGVYWCGTPRAYGIR